MKTKNNLDQEIKSVLEEFDEEFKNDIPLIKKSGCIGLGHLKSFLSSAIREQVRKAIERVITRKKKTTSEYEERKLDILKNLYPVFAIITDMKNCDMFITEITEKQNINRIVRENTISDTYSVKIYDATVFSWTEMSENCDKKFSSQLSDKNIGYNEAVEEQIKKAKQYLGSNLVKSDLGGKGEFIEGKFFSSEELSKL